MYPKKNKLQFFSKCYFNKIKLFLCLKAKHKELKEWDKKKGPKLFFFFFSLKFRLGHIKARIPHLLSYFPRTPSKWEHTSRRQRGSSDPVWCRNRDDILRSLLRGPRIWGANWLLIRAAVSAVAFCCRHKKQRKSVKSGLRIRSGASLSTDWAYRRWRRIGMWRTGQVAAGALHSLSQICAR